MRYVKTHITIECDTATNKVIIMTPTKRIALTPVTRRGSDIYAVVNDKPAPSLTTPAQLLRFIAQSLIDTKQVKDEAKKESE